MLVEDLNLWIDSGLVEHTLSRIGPICFDDLIWFTQDFPMSPLASLLDIRGEGGY